MPVLFGRLIANEPVGDRRVVEKAAAEVGVLRAGAGQNAEHVRVERPCAEALRERSTKEEIGRSRAGLEFGVEQFALRIEAVRGASRQFYAEQETPSRCASPDC